MMKRIFALIALAGLLSGCASTIRSTSDIGNIPATVPAYDFPSEFSGAGYYKVYAISETMADRLEAVRRTGNLKFEKVIGEDLFFSEDSAIEVDCPDGTKEWAPVLTRYKLKGWAFGPVNEGLRLGLTVDRADRNGVEEFTVTVAIKNTTSGDVTLVPEDALSGFGGPILLADEVAQQFGTNSFNRTLRFRGTTFDAYLKSEIRFSTFPEVPTEEACIEDYTFPALKQKIPSGGQFIASWKAGGRRLKNEFYHNTCGRFPFAGLYTVRAEMTVETSNGSKIHLFSNPQQVAVGGQASIPKSTVGRIISVLPEETVAIIDLGSHHGIKNGEVFRVGLGHGPEWRVEVVTAYQLGSRCRIIPPPDLKTELKAGIEKFFMGRTRNAHLLPSKGSMFQMAGEIISANNWSQSDPEAGKMISETDEHWDVSFPIPDAIDGGEKPAHRIVRVFKAYPAVRELGID